MKKQRFLGCMLALSLVCAMGPIGATQALAAGNGTKAATEASGQGAKTKENSGKSAKDAEKSSKKTVKTSAKSTKDSSKTDKSAENPAKTAKDTAKPAEAAEKTAAEEVKADPNAPVFTTQPAAVEFVTEESEYKAPSFSVTVELPKDSKAEDLTLQWYVNGIMTGEAKKVAEGKGTETFEAKELAGQKAGIYPVYCRADYTVEGVPYSVDSYVSNFIVCTGVMKGSVLTIPVVGEKWETVGKAVEMTMLTNEGKIPALVVAANDYKETAEGKDAKVAKVSEDTIRRAELQLGGIESVWVSAASADEEDPGVIDGDDTEPTLDQAEVKDHDASCTLRENFSEAAATRGYGPVAYYEISGVKGSEEEGLAATLPFPKGVTEKDSLLVLHENDGMVEIIEADEAALSESGLTFRAFADGIYAMAKKGAPEDHTGHVWEFSEFTYEDDGNGKMTKAEAVYVCKNDPEHVDFAEATFKTQETKPTCTRDGSIGYVLSVSAKNSLDGKAHKDSGYLVKTVEATGHDWGEWTVTKEPTATEPGERTRTCKNDPSHVEKEEIPAKSVSYSFTASSYSWTKNSGTALPLTVKRSVDDDQTFSLFSGVTVDGKWVSKTNYTTEKGSVKVIFRNSYLQSLAAGKHTVVVSFQDGNATTQLEIKSASGGSSGNNGNSSNNSNRNNSNSNSNSSRGRTIKTGNDAHMVLWETMCGGAVLGIVLLLALRKKGYLR